MSYVRHLGIIMDGNGRWAKARRRERFFGHLRGARVAQKIIEECATLKLEALTLYAFSTENWYRPTEEVSFLMQLLRRQLIKERKNLIKNNIQFSIIGDLSRLPETVQEEVRETIRATENCTGMKLIFALSYGSRQEITEACQKLAKKAVEGELRPEDIREEDIQGALQTSHLPNPDLIIRTSGEFRLSNFLLWQAAYSEIFISHELWPDFTIHSLHNALKNYSSRTRRFGRIDSSQPNMDLTID